MQRVSEAVWAQLLAAYERADAAAVDAYAIYDEEPVVDGIQEPTAAQLRYEELRAAANELEDKVLGVVAPTVAGVSAQLRIFALSYQSLDLDRAPEDSEDREAAILRRIYAGLTKAGA